MNNSVASAITSVMGITAAVMATLPYPWAKIAATAIAAGIGATHGIGVIAYASPKSTSKTGVNQ